MITDFILVEHSSTEINVYPRTERARKFTNKLGITVTAHPEWVMQMDARTVQAFTTKLDKRGLTYAIFVAPKTRH